MNNEHIFKIFMHLETFEPRSRYYSWFAGNFEADTTSLKYIPFFRDLEFQKLVYFNKNTVDPFNQKLACMWNSTCISQPYKGLSQSTKREFEHCLHRTAT